MKKLMALLIAGVFAAAFMTGCKSEEPAPTDGGKTTTKTDTSGKAPDTTTSNPTPAPTTAGDAGASAPAGDAGKTGDSK